MTTPVGRRSGDVEALLVLVAVLAMANVVRSLALSEATQFTFNVALAGVAVALGRSAGVRRREIGLAADQVHLGLRYGTAAFVVVALVVTVAAVVPWLAPIFDDSRADAGLFELLVRALLVIPLGTVLMEEIIFRGELLALLRRVVPTIAAIAVASVLFGLWHVFPAWLTPPDNVALDDLARSETTLGTLLSTTVAGAVFCWLRLASGSLVAPILAHTATNVIPLLAAALASG